MGVRACGCAELGVLCWKVDADNYESDPVLEAVKNERNYTSWVSKYICKGVRYSKSLTQTRWLVS